MTKISKKKIVILSLVFALVGISAFSVIANVSATETGAITVCKIIIDGDGNIVDGSENPGSFVIPSGTNNQPMPTTTFSTPLNLNADIIGNDSINDAECVEHSGIGITTYYYGQEQVTGDNFKEPLYNDQLETGVTSTNSFYSFDTSNSDANGIINLVQKGPTRTLVILNRYELPPPEYSPHCGDGEVNQDWEQCDTTEGCTEQCQLEDNQQCTDLTLAKINVTDVRNFGPWDMTSDIFLGSATNKIPQGVWFLLYQNGIYQEDENLLGAYEDVPGLAVQRLEGKLRTLAHGNNPTAADREHISGNIAFYNVSPVLQEDDLSDDNPLDNGFNGTGIGGYNAGDDEVFLQYSTTTQSTTSNFWLTVNVADDSFYTVYDTPTVCEEPEYSPYCGDGEVNQDWEQCDSTADGCTVQCQFLVPQQCTDLTLAKINVADVQNWGNGNMTSDLFLGSSSYKIPQGVWFLLYQAGVYTVDPDLLNTYEDVAGLAVQRLEGSLRTLIYGNHPTSADKEHVDGAIEFYNTSPISQQDDTSDDNKLENGFNGTGMTTYSPGDDEVWFTEATTAQATTSNFWLTVDVADDSFYTVYDTPTVCEDPEPVCGNEVVEEPEQCDDGNTEDGDGCSSICELEQIPPPNTNQKPVITIIGDNPVVMTVGEVFEDEGSTAQDVEDGDITSDIVVSGDAVNNSVVGVYFINYDVVDSQGLAADTKTRKVKVNGNIIGGCIGACGPPVFPTPTSTPTTTPPVATTTPTVLGTTTPAACNYLLDYLKINQTNNPSEVRKLQAFLKYFESEDALEVSGIFGQDTFDAVSRFQLKYANDVLTPWGLTAPTGYVYITTKKKINEIYCQREFPLTEEQQKEIDVYSEAAQTQRQGSGVAQDNAKLDEISEVIAGIASSITLLEESLKQENVKQEDIKGDDIVLDGTDLEKISEVITDITSTVATLEESIKKEGILGEKTNGEDKTELNLAVGELLQKEMENTDQNGYLTKLVAGVGGTTVLNVISWIGVILGILIVLFVPLYYRKKDKKVQKKTEFTSTQRYPIIGNMPNNTPIE